MANKSNHVDEHKKEFLRIFDSLCSNGRNRFTVWSDFVFLTAAYISNSTDKTNAQHRAEQANEISKKYTSDEIENMAGMLEQVVSALDEDTDQDFLGELYMACKLGNEYAGQFFTPYDVCKAMSKISFDPGKFNKPGFISVNDPACGAGATLISFANLCKQNGINYQKSVLFTAQDIDLTAGLMCYIQLSLLGCSGYVVIDNSISNPTTAYDKRGLFPAGDQSRIWYTPLFSSGLWHNRKLIAKIDLMTS